LSWQEIDPVLAGWTPAANSETCANLVLAWSTASTDPLIRSFTRIEAASYRQAAAR
jgi:hypothetical protein